jgi:hypothetical protein
VSEHSSFRHQPCDKKLWAAGQNGHTAHRKSFY